MRSRVCRHSLTRGKEHSGQDPVDMARVRTRIGSTLHAPERSMLPERPSDRRTTVMTYREATLLIKWLENKMNYCLLWNSSKLSSGRQTETSRNQSRRSNMLSHPRKLLSSSMDGAGKIFYHPARSTQQHIKPARTVGAVRDADGASGFAACRRSDCDRNADCRQNVLRARQHRCSAGRATGCNA